MNPQLSDRLLDKWTTLMHSQNAKLKNYRYGNQRNNQTGEPGI